LLLQPLLILVNHAVFRRTLLLSAASLFLIFSHREEPEWISHISFKQKQTPSYFLFSIPSSNINTARCRCVIISLRENVCTLSPTTTTSEADA
jgi:hypothetical protein